MTAMKKIRLLDGSFEEVKFGTVVTSPETGRTLFVKNDAGGDEVMLDDNLRGRKVVRSKRGPRIINDWINHDVRSGDTVFYIAKDGVVVCWGLKFFYDMAEAPKAPNRHHHRQTEKAKVVDWSPGVSTITTTDTAVEPEESITDAEAKEMLGRLTPGAGKSNHHCYNDGNGRGGQKNPNQRRRHHKGLPTYVR